MSHREKQALLTRCLQYSKSSIAKLLNRDVIINKDNNSKIYITLYVHNVSRVQFIITAYCRRFVRRRIRLGLLSELLRSLYNS